jgi:hypothetical protein
MHRARGWWRSIWHKSTPDLQNRVFQLRCGRSVIRLRWQLHQVDVIHPLHSATHSASKRRPGAIYKEIKWTQRENDGLTPSLLWAMDGLTEQGKSVEVLESEMKWLMSDRRYSTAEFLKGRLLTNVRELKQSERRKVMTFQQNCVRTLIHSVQCNNFDRDSCRSEKFVVAIGRQVEQIQNDLHQSNNWIICTCEALRRWRGYYSTSQTTNISHGIWDAHDNINTTDPASCDLIISSQDTSHNPLDRKFASPYCHGFYTLDDPARHHIVPMNLSFVRSSVCDTTFEFDFPFMTFWNLDAHTCTIHSWVNVFIMSFMIIIVHFYHLMNSPSITSMHWSCSTNLSLSLRSHVCVRNEPHRPDRQR